MSRDRRWSVDLTEAELRALFAYLAVTLNDSESVETTGLTGREVRALHRAAGVVDAVHDLMRAEIGS